MSGVSPRIGVGVAYAYTAVCLAMPSPASASVGPACQPSRLGRSALLARAVTVSPTPGSLEAPPRTQISFVGVPVGALRSVRVVGSRTGAHPGRLRAYSQGDGGSFVPVRPFAEGELVTVRAKLQQGSRVVPLADRFAIERHDVISSTPEAARPVPKAGVQSFASRPALHPPTAIVSANSPAAASGDVFVAPYSAPGQSGPMILDWAGQLVWFKPLGAHSSATNFRVQEYLGRPVLTWWQGNITRHGFGRGEGVIADASYTDIAHVRAGNGLLADLHEFLLTPRGTALITAYDPVRCRVSAVGGPADGAVTNGILQEIDIPTGLVRFQWSSLDHVALTDSFEGARSSDTEQPYDFFHINSIEAEPDGGLLVSARNTWATYDIAGRSGQIAWQLGGRRSTFKLGSGVATAWQHDSRLQADGSISIFDNGASPLVHHQSRGIVVRVNAQQRTATLLGQFVRPSRVVAPSQGSMQRLGNGDWFIGYGQEPIFSEFSPSGALLFDAHMPPRVQSYRDFRFPWQAAPAHAPTFVAKREASGAHTLYASWNGATQVAGWRVLAGRN